MRTKRRITQLSFNIPGHTPDVRVLLMVKIPTPPQGTLDQAKQDAIKEAVMAHIQGLMFFLDVYYGGPIPTESGKEN